MNKFQYKLAKFMMGRYGMDQMSRGLMVLAIVLILLDFIVPSNVLSTLALVIIAYGYFRIFSRNVARRQAENRWYLSHVGNRFQALSQRDHKHYRYFKCPTCGQVLRAPKGRGKIRVTCSSCHNIFKKKV